jgi:hypothetical protein
MLSQREQGLRRGPLSWLTTLRNFGAFAALAAAWAYGKQSDGVNMNEKRLTAPEQQAWHVGQKETKQGCPGNNQGLMLACNDRD